MQCSLIPRPCPHEQENVKTYTHSLHLLVQGRPGNETTYNMYNNYMYFSHRVDQLLCLPCSNCTAAGNAVYPSIIHVSVPTW